MSDAATKGREVKQRWAIPGSAHDRIVRFTKIALPSAVGVLIAVLAIAPLDKHGDVSFILDKKKVENAPERMRVEQAKYVGTDNKGQRFEMTAQRALQRSSDVPLVDIWGMFARLGLEKGPLMIAANQGQYNLDTQRVAINGPVKVAGPDGYRLATRDVSVDLKQRQLRSAGPVAGQMRLGQFQAGQLHADLGNRTVVLDGGARLKIVQGAVR
ncbi:LPS export ABC transporter periplasmic protein LptC [Sphingomonas sp. URHD0057]|uniref:LPS export ABC transporter periplasmic protein LptC n=1 Tax=Sphingomonas sp. URHD0057 TaxID=1380389 RepID=UPI0004917F47|nr:LPS export ABC transporter periplasmic protein LptC [Sphingomonas sp. URHD0057]